MTTLNLDDLVPQVLLSVTSCPKQTARLYLRDAARKFARDALIWDVMLGTGDITVENNPTQPTVVQVPSVPPETGGGSDTSEFVERTIYVAQRAAGSSPSDFTASDFTGGRNVMSSAVAVTVPTVAAGVNEIVGIAIPVTGGELTAIDEVDLTGMVTPFGANNRVHWAPTTGSSDVLLDIGGVSHRVYATIDDISRFLLGAIGYRLNVPGGARTEDPLTPATPIEGDFLLPDNSEIVLISRVTFEDEDPPESLAMPFAYDYQTEELSLSPEWVRMDGELKVWAVLQPVRTTNTIPEKTFGRWDMAIRVRALNDILSIPGRDWSNPAAARMYYSQYQEQVSRALTRKGNSGTANSPRTGRIAFL